MTEGSKPELRETLARAIELILQTYPEIAKKAKDRSLEEMASDIMTTLERVKGIEKTKEGLKLYLEASK